jgi:hypothetical protein
MDPKKLDEAGSGSRSISGFGINSVQFITRESVLQKSNSEIVSASPCAQ